MASTARASHGFKTKTKEISSKGSQSVEPILLVSSNSVDERAPTIGKVERQREIPSRNPEVMMSSGKQKDQRSLEAKNNTYFHPGAIFAISTESPKHKHRTLKKTAQQSQYLPPVQHKSPYLSSRFAHNAYQTSNVHNRRNRLNSDEYFATSYGSPMTKTPNKSKSLRKVPGGLSSSRKTKKAGSDFSSTMAACFQEHPINQVVPQIVISKENNTPLPFTPCKGIDEITAVQHDNLLDSFSVDNHCVSQLPQINQPSSVRDVTNLEIDQNRPSFDTQTMMQLTRGLDNFTVNLFDEEKDIMKTGRNQNGSERRLSHKNTATNIVQKQPTAHAVASLERLVDSQVATAPSSPFLETKKFTLSKQDISFYSGRKAQSRKANQLECLTTMKKTADQQQQSHAISNFLNVRKKSASSRRSLISNPINSTRTAASTQCSQASSKRVTESRNTDAKAQVVADEQSPERPKYDKPLKFKIKLTRCKVV